VRFYRKIQVRVSHRNHEKVYSPLYPEIMYRGQGVCGLLHSAPGDRTEFSVMNAEETTIAVESELTVDRMASRLDQADRGRVLRVPCGAPAPISGGLPMLGSIARRRL
jgi:hypothetical protein